MLTRLRDHFLLTRQTQKQDPSMKTIQEYRYLSLWVPSVITTNASIALKNDSTATTTTLSTTTIVEREEMKEEGILVAAAAAAAAAGDDDDDTTAIAVAVAVTATDVDVVHGDDVLDEDGIVATYGEYSQHRQSLSSIHASSYIKTKMNNDDDNDNEKKRETLKMDIEQNYSERIMTHMNRDHGDSLIAYVLAFGTTGSTTITTTSSNDGEEKEDQEEGQLPVVLAQVLDGSRTIISAKLINVEIDRFLIDIVLRAEKDDNDNDNENKNHDARNIIISNICVPYDRTLQHPHELHVIALALHQQAYHKLGLAYKIKHGYYRPALHSKAFQFYKAFHNANSTTATTTTTTTRISNRMTLSMGMVVVGVAAVAAYYYYYDRNNNNNNKSSKNTSNNPCKVEKDDDCNGLLFS